MIRSLFDAGVDMFRLNFSHGTHEDHRKRFEAIRDVERDVDRLKRKLDFGAVRAAFDPIETLVPHDGDRFGHRRQKRRSRAYTSELGQAEESLSRLR